jgi:group II intron reverse transcriptase/maturase
MLQVVDTGNIERAMKRVKRNKGSSGIDGMTVAELPEWFRYQWLGVREQLLSGHYQPQPIRRATIPKPGGGQRELGIPTVVDRVIQQALLQVLQPGFDASFSEHSHGFRPGRRAHDAVCEARQYIQDGKGWVVDVDLEKFFDRVNHDMLMGRLAKRLTDRRVLKLIRGYLNAGVLVNGVVVERYQGTPQGGPLSPLLANVYLDEVDKELERRGHTFVRYADDLRVYVGSERAGHRVMRSLVKLFGKLKLRVNDSKSAVAKSHRRPFLSFAFWWGRDGVVKPIIAAKARQRFKHRIRQLTRRVRGRSLDTVIAELRSYLLGWKGYFHLAETPSVFKRFGKWIRRRLRAYLLKQWKRGPTMYRELRKLGASERNARPIAFSSHKWWKTSHRLMSHAVFNRFFKERGLPDLTA